jgi:hypothetical protein
MLRMMVVWPELQVGMVVEPYLAMARLEPVKLIEGEVTSGPALGNTPTLPGCTKEKLSGCRPFPEYLVGEEAFRPRETGFASACKVIAQAMGQDQG